MAALTGCDRADDPLPTLPTEAAASSQPGEDPSPSFDPFPPAGATDPATSASPTFGGYVAVPCNGRPPADQVVALVRRAGLLPSGSTPAVATGPLCAGTWQYTVLTVSGREPLQVVSKGAPGSLTLVTAGTDVCVAEVRVAAPQGIFTVTHC